MQYKSYPVISAYRKSSIKPRGGGVFQAHFEGRLNRAGGVFEMKAYFV